MDYLIYNYNEPEPGRKINNRLAWVDDLTGLTPDIPDDLEPQMEGNYTYDAIGNLTRDVQGNVMAVYKWDNTGEPLLAEQYIYGSSRLGSVNRLDFLEAATPTHAIGLRQYELTNHLGNVLTTVTDRPIAYSADVNAPVEGYTADIASTQDYYPFGSIMPGRNFNSNNYRYGFNGVEKDDEISGAGNSLNFKFRMYDTRLGRFKSVDPLFKDYPWNSTYAFAENDVIRNLDLEGAEKYDYKMKMTKQGNVQMKLTKTTDIVDKVIVGYRLISAGADIQTPIYETQVNQRQAYTINGRNSSLNTVQELQGTKTPTPIVQAGMNKIKSDYARTGGQFSDNYNIDFGRFMFEAGFSSMSGNTKSDYVNSANATWNILDSNTFSNGATLFHLYENFARKNDNTGYDKLLHFSRSAQLTIKSGATWSKTLGIGKETKDWFSGKIGHGVGWDNNDMKANEDGINYGKTVNKSIETGTDEFKK